jgi:hypothetical protein
MVVSARNLVHETKMYGPFRLIDTCSRLITTLEEEGSCNEFFGWVKTEIETNKYAVMTDEEGFITFLDSLTQDLVERLKEER